MESHTTTSTRVIIWIIAIVMAGGFVGSYFLIVAQNNSAVNSADQLQQAQLEQEAQENQVVDPTAYVATEDVTELSTQILKEGTGDATVQLEDTITVHYKGTIANSGVKFDSSYDTGEPVTFALSQSPGVIPGWQQGVMGMKVGEKRLLIIPSELAYGSQEVAGIPADSDLVFEVEVLAINPAE